MAYWDSKAQKIVESKPRPWPDYPGWLCIDCGCCAGIEWGGEYPKECQRCGGSGYLAKHEKSHTIADYPGGPFRGREL